MTLNRKSVSFLIAMTAICAGGLFTCDLMPPDDGPGDTGDLCCDPTTKPGSGDNPTCIEGVTCCATGQWACNNGDGSTSCEAVGAECSEVCGGIAGIGCEDPDMFCQFNEGECCCDFQGVCVPQPEACIELFDPVCGCDGVTYSNSCFAASAGVSIDHTGPCPQ